MKVNYLLSGGWIMSDAIDINKVKKLYHDMPCIWPESDLWHTYTYKYMHKYFQKELPKLKPNNNTKILNAGSAGNTYDIEGEHYHVDICYDKISHLKHAAEASIEDLPYNDNYFDGCICMGSVLNYSDAAKSLFEIARVIKSEGFLIFDFEQSRSLQFVCSKIYNKNAAIINTFNSGYMDQLWVYSTKYIFSILKSAGIKVQNTEYYHILSPLAYKIIKNENKAAAFAKFDAIARYIPLLRKCSCNVILTCRKS